MKRIAVISLSVRAHGPVFDGTAARLITDYLQAATKEVSEEGDRLVHAHLKGVLKHPTGYYESQVQTEPRGQTDYAVIDSGVIYGPWLEGTGSRNATTRFKGYATFRKMTGQLDRQARSIAYRVLDSYVRRMN